MMSSSSQTLSWIPRPGLQQGWLSELSSQPADATEVRSASARDRARQLFSEGLQLAMPDVRNGDVAFACSEVECAIFAATGGVNKDYKAKSRRLSFNIKDPRNPDLRRRVLKGEITGMIALHCCPDHFFGFCRDAAVHSCSCCAPQSALLSLARTHMLCI